MDLDTTIILVKSSGIFIFFGHLGMDLIFSWNHAKIIKVDRIDFEPFLPELRKEGQEGFGAIRSARAVST